MRTALAALVLVVAGFGLGFIWSGHGDGVPDSARPDAAVVKRVSSVSVAVPKTQPIGSITALTAPAAASTPTAATPPSGQGGGSDAASAPSSPGTTTVPPKKPSSGGGFGSGGTSG